MARPTRRDAQPGSDQPTWRTDRRLDRRIPADKRGHRGQHTVDGDQLATAESPKEQGWRSGSHEGDVSEPGTSEDVEPRVRFSASPGRNPGLTTAGPPLAKLDAMTTPIGFVRDLRMEYGAGPSQVTALDGFSIDLPAGSFTAVIGPSRLGQVHTASLCPRASTARPPARSRSTVSAWPSSTRPA